MDSLSGVDMVVDIPVVQQRKGSHSGDRSEHCGDAAGAVFEQSRRHAGRCATSGASGETDR